MQRWCTNWDRVDHSSFSICFWQKQWHLFLRVEASPFQLRSVSFFLVELDWVCLSFCSHAPSSRWFHWLLGSDNHFVISQLWWWCWLVHTKKKFELTKIALCPLPIIIYFVESALHFCVMIWHDRSSWYCRNNKKKFIMTPPTIYSYFD